MISPLFRAVTTSTMLITIQLTTISSISYANKLKSNNDLFSVDELFDIFTSAMEDLQRSSTKVQQIKVVMAVDKYAHGLD